MVNMNPSGTRLGRGCPGYGEGVGFMGQFSCLKMEISKNKKASTDREKQSVWQISVRDCQGCGLAVRMMTDGMDAFWKDEC